MHPSDRAPFATLMTQALAFYRQDVTDFTLDVWWQACQPFEVEQVRKALTAHAMDPDRGQFPPKPADLVRQLQGTHGDRALLAWGKVYDSMRSVGAYSSIDFGEPAIHAAIIDIGGWVALCRSAVDELPFWQRRFCDAYRTYTARGAPDAPLRLTGDHDATNAALGYDRSTRPALTSPIRAPRLA
jgi:hypothetical protein